jgi:hypothetical protein
VIATTLTPPNASAPSAPKTTDSSAQSSPDSGGSKTSDKTDTAISKNDTAKKMYCN